MLILMCIQDIRFLAMVNEGTYEDPYADVSADLLEMYYGVAGKARHRPVHQTGAGQDAEEDEEANDRESDGSDEEMGDDESESESEDESDESDGNERRDTGVSGQGDVLSRAAATQEANIRHAAIKVCLGYT